MRIVRQLATGSYHTGSHENYLRVRESQGDSPSIYIIGSTILSTWFGSIW